MGRSWNDTVCSSVSKNKAKRFANQLLPDVINALACLYCYFLRAESNGYHQKKKQLHWSFLT